MQNSNNKIYQGGNVHLKMVRFFLPSTADPKICLRSIYCYKNWGGIPSQSPKKAKNRKKNPNQKPLRFTGDMKQEARQTSSVNTVTFCPTNHIRARKLASHLHPGRWQTHQCLKWVKGGRGTGKLKRETICLQYTHLSVHSITCQNANTTFQWAGDIQKLSLQRDREKIQKKLNTFSRFLPKFCQLTWDNTRLCSSSHSEAVGCASPAASSPKSRSVFTFPFVPIPPCSPATKRHSLLSLITQVQILALCHHKAPLCRLSKEKEGFPTQRNAVLFPQEMGGMFSPFCPTPVSPAPQGGWTSSSPGHIFQEI